MPTQNTEKVDHDPAETNALCVVIGKIEENVQITTADTGWSEEEKERMKAYGYDGLDIVRAWYS